MMEVLSTSLNSVNPPDSFSPVQNHWNSLELLLINATDSVAPLITVCQNTKTKTTALPNHIKNAINKCKRLLKTDKVNSTTTNLPTIKLLNEEIKAFHLSKRISNVRRATTGQKGSIWNAVKQAKNLVLEEIPGELTLGGCLWLVVTFLTALLKISMTRSKILSVLVGLKKMFIMEKINLLLQIEIL